jgi:hypothetical protein
MHLKANLHFHTSDDPVDRIPYTTYTGIDRAAAADFNVLALTCHNRVAWCNEYADYAARYGITLISGIEKDIGEPGTRTGHVLMLNVNAGAEQVHTFDDLRAYRAAYPETFVIAPHPYFPFPGSISLHTMLERHIDCFDAIEHSWFYHRYINCNAKAAAVAQRYEKPLIAMSDTHFFSVLDTDYCYIDTTDAHPESITRALAQHSFENHTRPKHLFREMLLPFGRFMLYNKGIPLTMPEQHHASQ